MGVRLFSYYIFSSFASGLPLSLSLVSSNVAGYTKKATVSAMMFIAYCAGNIIGPFLFFSHEAPRYQASFHYLSPLMSAFANMPPAERFPLPHRVLLRCHSHHPRPGLLLEARECVA